MRIRLLPTLMVLGSLLAAAKIGDTWRGFGDQSGGITVSSALAQEAEPQAAEGTVDDAPSAVPPSAALRDLDAAEEASGPGTTLSIDGGDDGVRTRLKELIVALVNQELDAALANRRFGGPESDALYSEAEVRILQSLSDRRDELVRREQALSMRENLLAAAEQRIDEKIAELTKLEAEVKGLIRQYDDQEEAKLKSLVKIYQNMKPKDAARILEGLDMEVLLSVAERMREAKLAPILAQMDPEKAKTVTEELANRSNVSEAGATTQPANVGG